MKALDVDANFQGNLVFKDAVNLHINGNFEGRLESRGTLLIGKTAHVKATIISEHITVSGNVWGDITALSEFRLTASGRLTGNVKSPSILMEKGSIFNGECRMEDEPAKVVVPTGGARQTFLTVDEVAGYLSVESDLIAQWAEAGRLPGLREGSAWRFNKKEVDEWIASGRIA